MKTTLAILACLTLTSIASAQTPTTAKSQPVERYDSLRLNDRKPYQFQPRMITVVTDNGIRMYATQAEADRAEKKISEERVSAAKSEKSFAEFNKNLEKRAEERSNNAMWKLVAFGVGLFIGIMRIIWGVITG